MKKAMKKPSRWIIVSNRLPFALNKKTGKVGVSSGGLVTAISGIVNTHTEKVWVGSAESSLSREKIKEASKNDQKFADYIPIYINDSDYDAYYNHISNDVLWPLFHYESHISKFNWKEWESYEKVNLLFAKKIHEIYREGDLIWIHDFHLFLVPRFLKDLQESIQIGFFLHIPFPSSELLKQLPAVEQILKGILGADLIGFHEYSYLRHFRNSIRAVLGVDSTLLQTNYQNRTITLGIFPVSIDTPHFIRRSRSNAVLKISEQIKKKNQYLLLGVDRLDYTKGIDLKLRAFQIFLRQYQRSVPKKVSLIQVAVPTRREIPVYIQLKKEIEQLVGEINGEFGEPNYTPIQYLYTSVDFESLLALYRTSDVLLVTSKRDGMNLVTLEYIASQDARQPGIAVLSEFAGVASILPHVFTINPWDTVDTAKTISQALRLGQEEKVQRQARMLEYLKGYTGTHWANGFIQSLSSIQESQHKSKTLSLKEGAIVLPKQLEEAIQKKKKKQLILFLDYDGTLVPIQVDAQKAVLDKKTERLIKKLSQNKRIKLIILSGRKKKFLLSQFGSLNVDIAAEHGAIFYSARNKKTISLVRSDIKPWYTMAIDIMSSYTEHVPESHIEKKEYAICWHYRKSPKEFATFQANKLAEELDIGLASLPVTTIHGKKVIETRAMEANKGSFVNWYLSQDELAQSRYILAIGDDRTDEDMFRNLPEKESVSIKIGTPPNPPTFADYTLPSQDLVNPLLSKVQQICVMG